MGTIPHIKINSKFLAKISVTYNKIKHAGVCSRNEGDVDFRSQQAKDRMVPFRKRCTMLLKYKISVG